MKSKVYEKYQQVEVISGVFKGIKGSVLVATRDYLSITDGRTSYGLKPTEVKLIKPKSPKSKKEKCLCMCHDKVMGKLSTHIPPLCVCIPQPRECSCKHKANCECHYSPLPHCECNCFCALPLPRIEPIDIDKSPNHLQGLIHIYSDNYIYDLVMKLNEVIKVLNKLSK